MTDAKPRARFAQRGTVPPVGWIYELVHEDVKYRFQSPMHLGLMQQLKQWHIAHKVDWPGDEEMQARVEHYICQRLPKGFCVGGPDRPVVPYLSRAMIRDGTRLLLGRIFSRKEFLVAPATAEKRAKICANCRSNMHGICTSCIGNEFFDIFGWFIRAGKKTPYDQALDVCVECGCLLRAKVWVSDATLFELSKHAYPENCWLFGTPACLPAKKESGHEKEVPDQA